jgi:hypothetical protein
LDRLPEHELLAAISSSHADRLIALLKRDDGSLIVAKIGTTDDPGLRRELNLLRSLPALSFMPQIVVTGSDEYPLLATLHAGTPVNEVTDLPEVMSIVSQLGELDITHGDLTPWNVVQGGAGMTLLDWEKASRPLQPLHDAAWFLVHFGVFTGHMSPALLARWVTQNIDLVPRVGLSRDEASAAALSRALRSLEFSAAKSTRYAASVADEIESQSVGLRAGES